MQRTVHEMETILTAYEVINSFNVFEIVEVDKNLDCLGCKKLEFTDQLSHANLSWRLLACREALKVQVLAQRYGDSDTLHNLPYFGKRPKD